MMQHHAEQVAETGAEPGKAAFKRLVNRDEWTFPTARGCCVLIGMSSMMDVLVEPHHQGGNKRSREGVTGEHRKHDSLGQWHEQISRHPGKEKHRDENDADAKRRNE